MWPPKCKVRKSNKNSYYYAEVKWNRKETYKMTKYIFYNIFIINDDGYRKLLTRQIKMC